MSWPPYIGMLFKLPFGNGYFPPYLCQFAGLLVRHTSSVCLRAIPWFPWSYKKFLISKLETKWRPVCIFWFKRKGFTKCRKKRNPKTRKIQPSKQPEPRWNLRFTAKRWLKKRSSRAETAAGYTYLRIGSAIMSKSSELINVSFKRNWRIVCG